MVTWIKVVYTLIVLVYFSILDIKYRDIPDKLIWLSLGVSIILALISAPYYISVFHVLPLPLFLVTLLTSMMIVLVLILMYYFGYMGGADVIIIGELAILFPFYAVYGVSLMGRSCMFHLPPIILILLYAASSMILIIVFKVLVGVAMYRRYLPKNTAIFTKILLLAFGRPVRIRDYLGMKHYYPLSVIKETPSGVEVSYRLGFDVEEEYYEHQEYLRSLINRGVIDPDDYIWVTLGIPFIVPLLLGYLLLLVFGDYPLLSLLGAC